MMLMIDNPVITAQSPRPNYVYFYLPAIRSLQAPPPSRSNAVTHQNTILFSQQQQGSTASAVSTSAVTEIGRSV